MADNERIYCGNAKTKIVKLNGKNIEIMKVTLSLDTLMEAVEHQFNTNDGRPKIKIDLWPRRDGADQYGNTHSVQIDTYKPPKKDDGYQSRPSPPPFTPPPSQPPVPQSNQEEFGFDAPADSDESIDDIPF